MPVKSGSAAVAVGACACTVPIAAKASTAAHAKVRKMERFMDSSFLGF
jgi:hypothetical protein